MLVERDQTMLRNKKVVAAIVVVLLVNIGQWVWIAHTANKLVKTNQKSDAVYMICDVYDVIYNGKDVEIDVILPNGELLTRKMSVDDDLPEDFTEVVIETANLDDYSTYKIVGMR